MSMVLFGGGYIFVRGREEYGRHIVWGRVEYGSGEG